MHLANVFYKIMRIIIIMLQGVCGLLVYESASVHARQGS